MAQKRGAKPKVTQSKSYDAYRNFDQFYTSTSNAYKVDDILYAEYEPVQAEYIRKKALLQTKRGRIKRTIYILNKNDGRHIPAMAYVALLFFFLGAAGMIYSRAATAGVRTRVTSIQRELKEAREMNSALNVELYENIDKEEIERIATMRLGMTKRMPYHEIHVSVPRSSYIVQSRSERTEIEIKETFFDRIANFFN